MSNNSKTSPKGNEEVFCKYIKMKDGSIRYPKKGKVFHFYVNKDKKRA